MRLFAGTPFDRPSRCERCGALEEECACPPPADERIPPEEQVARLTVEKRKKGKFVTVIRGLAPQQDELRKLLSHLKSHCGAGGTLDDECLEIQGQHLVQVRAELVRLGYSVSG